jgi:large subunit ribosomal protein L9
VSVGVKVNVARSTDEAEQQEKGVDVIAAMFEDEAAAAAATDFEAGNGEEPEGQAPAPAAAPDDAAEGDEA